MNQINLNEIYKRYLEGTATGDEIRYLLACFNDPAMEPEIGEIVAHQLDNTPVASKLLLEADLEKAVMDVQRTLRRKIAEESLEPRTMMPWRRIAAAAAILFLCLCIGAYVVLRG